MPEPGRYEAVSGPTVVRAVARTMKRSSPADIEDVEDVEEKTAPKVQKNQHDHMKRSSPADIEGQLRY